MFRIQFASKCVLLAVLAFGVTLLGILVGPAGAQTPTADQIEAFQNLDPQQQQAIMEGLGSGGLTGSGSRSRSGRAMQDRDVRFPDLVRRPGRVEDDEDRLREMMGLERDPRFRAEDTLLLSLQIRTLTGPDPVELVTQSSSANGPNGLGTSTQSVPTGTPPASSQPREPIKRSELETKRLEDLRTRILRRNPYMLDKWGILQIPELGPVPLAGLNVVEARQRIAAEPLLADFVVQVTLLPVKQPGGRSLKPFGYEAFEGIATTFAPATDVPVPAEYVVGPGDTFEVQLFGSTKGRYSLVVGRNGEINFPEIGPVSVAGMTFDEAREMLQSRASQQLLGTQVSIQMGELRSIQVFVLGDATLPGSYTVSGLSTISNALYVSGGVRKIGSLRNIELKRGGRTVVRFDLYDLLLRGDTSNDVRLLPGDAIFIPPVGQMVGVSGEVRRPALYEIKGEKTTAELIALAGGLTAEADAKRATLERVDPERKRIVVDVDASKQADATALRNGDVLNIPGVRPTVEQSIKLSGHVFRPGEFQYRPGMRISQLIPTLEELQTGADQHYVLIRREVGPSRELEFVSVDLVRALEQPNSEADVLLAPRDQVFVFDMESGRDRLLQPLLRELKLQSTRSEPRAEVSVGGQVNAPGSYPLEKGMRVRDLIRAGGSLNEAAYGGEAELTRYSVASGEARKTELVKIDLARVMSGDPSANLVLQPYDFLVIKELPLWGAQEYVEVQGEVRFPGRYPIQRGETMRSLITRAGGLTEFAFVRGTVFTRDALKERERTQVKHLTDRLQLDLAQVALMAAQETGANAAQALTVGQQLLQQLRDAEPVGRLVIDLDSAMTADPGSPRDIVLKDGDHLRVPRVTQEVTVIGEVQSQTSHLFVEDLSVEEYIALSGGTTQRADKRRIYVVRADGSVISAGGTWFSLGGMDMQPGDTIVVPLDAERMRALPLWTAVTQIIYYLAVSVAAVNSF